MYLVNKGDFKYLFKVKKALLEIYIFCKLRNIYQKLICITFTWHTQNNKIFLIKI